MDVLRQTPVRSSNVISIYSTCPVGYGLACYWYCTLCCLNLNTLSMTRIPCALLMNSGRKFLCDNAKTISGENPPDMDLELLLAEIGECLLWRYLVSPRSTLPVARLFLSCFHSPNIIPASPSHPMDPLSKDSIETADHFIYVTQVYFCGTYSFHLTSFLDTHPRIL